MNLIELQKADPETWEEIQIAFGQLDRYQEDDNYCVDVMETIKCYGELQFPITYYIIQGCLQRAIEKRGWTWSMDCNNHRGVSLDIYIEETDEPDSEMQMLAVSRIETSSPAEALLSAYLEALHETS